MQPGLRGIVMRNEGSFMRTESGEEDDEEDNMDANDETWYITRQP
jgi:hypothetical protein